MVYLKTYPATKFPVEYSQVSQYYDLVSDASVEILGADTKTYLEYAPLCRDTYINSFKWIVRQQL